MAFFWRLLLVLVSVCLFSGLASAQTPNGPQGLQRDKFDNEALPEAFSCPTPSVLGEVSLRIAIDAKGNVSQAKALTGPEELMRAAEACARTWKYENPPSVSVTKTVAIRYVSRDCPPAESQRGQLQFSYGLRNRSNLVLAYIEGEQPPPPSYPEEERKAGRTGAIIVAVSLHSDGTVKEMHVKQGLSAVLDKGVMDRLRPLKFKVLDGVSEEQLIDLTFQIIFHATCVTPIVSNVN